MSLLSKAQIWEADDIEEREVEVPQWGGSVKIRSLTLEQISAIRAHAVKTVKGKEEVDARLQMAGLLCEGIIEPEIDFAEAQRLMRKSAAATSIIIQAINEVSGLLPEAVDEADKSTDDGPEPALSVFPSARTGHDKKAARAGDAAT
jgi:hypothetical protein